MLGISFLRISWKTVYSDYQGASKAGQCRDHDACRPPADLRFPRAATRPAARVSTGFATPSFNLPVEPESEAAARDLTLDAGSTAFASAIPSKEHCNA